MTYLVRKIAPAKWSGARSIEALPVRASPGDTLAEGLSDTHREIVDLKYPSLGVFAKIIIDLLSQNAPTTITKNKVKNIVKVAYNNKTNGLSCLPEDMQKAIEK